MNRFIDYLMDAPDWVVGPIVFIFCFAFCVSVFYFMFFFGLYIIIPIFLVWAVAVMLHMIGFGRE